MFSLLCTFCGQKCDGVLPDLKLPAHTRCLRDRLIDVTERMDLEDIKQKLPCRVNRDGRVFVFKHDPSVAYEHTLAGYDALKEQESLKRKREDDGF